MANEIISREKKLLLSSSLNRKIAQVVVYYLEASEPQSNLVQIN